jgi:hypothetical protein
MKNFNLADKTGGQNHHFTNENLFGFLEKSKL